MSLIHTVPTIRFQVLYVFLVLAHERRRILHFGVTAHPTAEWTAQQLRDAFPWDTERVIGTIRRECLDHLIVLNEASLHRHVKSFTVYYHESRTHLSLAKDAPEPRLVHSPEAGRIVAIRQVGGLHHRYERRAA